MKTEGRNAVIELLKTDKNIDKILVQKDLKDDASKRLINIIRSNKVKIQIVDKYVIDKESESKRSQGFIAYVSDYKYADLEDLIYDAKDKDGLIVILNEVLDPHNLGSIISHSRRRLPIVGIENVGVIIKLCHHIDHSL